MAILVRVSINGGSPIAGWFIRENPNLKWMTWGYSHFRTPPYLLAYIRWMYVLLILCSIQVSKLSNLSPVKICHCMSELSPFWWTLPGSIISSLHPTFSYSFTTWLLSPRYKGNQTMKPGDFFWDCRGARTGDVSVKNDCWVLACAFFWKSVWVCLLLVYQRL